jgi:DNA-binding phage protein
MTRGTITYQQGAILDTYRRALADWLQGAIQRTGTNKHRLRRDSGIARSQLYKILRAEASPRWGLVQKLANAMKVDPPRFPPLKQEDATDQALLKQVTADIDRATKVLTDLREALSRELIRKPHRRKKSR